MSGKKVLEEYPLSSINTGQTINRAFKRIARNVGLEKELSFQASRNIFAVMGVKPGIHIEILSKLKGHTNLKTTMVYAQVVDTVNFKSIILLFYERKSDIQVNIKEKLSDLL